MLALGCKAAWEPVDLDGDGFTAATGDCNEGSASVHVGAAEIWYDGLDQDCDGNDADQDGDGFVPTSYTVDFPDWQQRFPGHTALQVGDCWDDPTDPSFVAAYTPVWVDGEPSFRPTAAEVNPAATERWYDGVNMDCAGPSDFDQDADGFDSAFDPDINGVVGADCVDGSALDQVFVDEDDQPIDPADAGLGAADIHPGAEDTWYDGIDQDCDTADDYDQDGDGYRASAECDDQDPLIYPDPSAQDAWYDCVDSNCDGNDGDQDGDGYVPDAYTASCPDWQAVNVADAAGDCWDDPDSTAPEWRPANGWTQLGAEEVYPDATDRPYDGIDQDCGGEAGEWDVDADGFASADWPDRDGQAGLDCDDADPAVNPTATEQCGTPLTDDDCDGDTNDIGAADCTTWYRDADGDGYGLSSSSLCQCVGEGEFDASVAGDCDDARASVSPAGTESCNNRDDDCDGTVDDGVKSTWYTDADGDGYGDPAASTQACSAPSGTVANSTDCDDSDVGVNPGADEVCDSGATDEDCDGLTDDDDPGVTGTSAWYPDVDKDGYGDASAAVQACEKPSGTLSQGGDCEDSDATAYPGSHTTEIPGDGVDQDCDGQDACVDLDCDGRPDVVLAGSTATAGTAGTQSSLYFGVDSFAAPDTLTTASAQAVVAEDLDGDGYLDLVFANYTDGVFYEIDSTIFWGSASGHSDGDTTDLPTAGALDVAAEDLDGDGWIDLVFANYVTDALSAPDSVVYWNNAGVFSAADTTSLPTDHAGSVSAVDLDQDGWVDLVFSNVGDYALAGQSVVYFGGSAGYSTADRTLLSVVGSWEHGVGDLDCDGTLDLVFASYARYQSGSVINYSSTSRVFWGSASGWSDADKTDVGTYGAGWVLVQDLDGDGCDDVVFPNERNGNSSSYNLNIDSYVYFGGPSGLSSSRDELSTSSAERPVAADVDGDGYLELLIPFLRDSTTNYELSSRLFWGSAAGYSDTDAEDLATQGASGAAIADLDGDGAPELLFTGFRDNGNYSAATRIYDGSASWGTVTNLQAQGVWAPPLVVGNSAW